MTEKDLPLIEEIKYIRKKYKFETSKRLGQNFLINESVVEGIIESAGVKDSIVIEIGPGIGTLTARLAKEARQVIAVELDERLIPILKDRFSHYPNVEIIHGDILEIDLEKICESIQERYRNHPIKIIGNLPYYITTPIILKLIKREIPVESIVIMIQKEVAERIIAEPGSNKCGAITYAVHYYSVPSSIMEVKKESFYPKPKVDSMVIELNLRKEKAVFTDDEKQFFRIINSGFMHRRKTLLNALQSMGEYSKDELRAALSSSNIEERRRAESLSLQEFANLTNKLTREKDQ